MGEKPIGTELGVRVRQIRQLRHLSQQQLAERASVSPSFLSQLERGKSGASVSTAMRLAEGLGIRFADLFNSEAGIAVHTSYGDLSELELNPGHSKRLLSPPFHPTVELYSTTLEPGTASGESSYTYGDGDEFVIGTRGKLTVEIERSTYDVNVGDVLHFRSGRPHRMLNRSHAVGSAIVLVTPPTD